MTTRSSIPSSTRERADLCRLVRILVWAATACACAASWAQAYRCNVNGQTYYSDRPCNLETKLQMYGPLRSPPETRSPPRPPKADEHLLYLSSGCSAINEAIRTAPTRGVRPDGVQALREEYRQKCAMEDEDARRRVQQDKSAQRQTYIAQRDAAANEQRSSQDKQERCGAMRDVIALKRQRESQLNAKEVESLRALESTYDTTCIGK